MKFYSHRFIVGLIAFVVGVSGVWLCLLEPRKPDSEVIPVDETQTKSSLVQSDLQQMPLETEPQIEPQFQRQKPVSIKNLRPSSGFWGQDVKFLRQVSQVSKNRRDIVAEFDFVWIFSL